MLNKLRLSGVTLPFTDVLIAQLAIEHDVSLLSRDNHFKLIKCVLPESKFYPIDEGFKTEYTIIKSLTSEEKLMVKDFFECQLIELLVH